MNKQHFAEIVAGSTAQNIDIINGAFKAAYPDFGDLDVERFDDALKVLNVVFPKYALGATDAAPYIVQIGGSTGSHAQSFGLAFTSAYVNEIQGTAVEKFFSETAEPKKHKGDTGLGSNSKRSLGASRY